MKTESKLATVLVADPVCGMQVDPAHARASIEYQGKQYFFCCSSCAQRFSADPEKYLKPQPRQSTSGLVQMGETPSEAESRPPQARPAQQSLSKYFCPMDPEVISDKPGPCPKCGMALEQQPVTGAKTEYVCPMHPEIISETPGSCPICGMALEPRLRAVNAGEEPNFAACACDSGSGWH